MSSACRFFIGLRAPGLLATGLRSTERSYSKKGRGATASLLWPEARSLKPWARPLALASSCPAPE